MSRVFQARDVPEQIGTDYPAPHDAPCRARRSRRLGDHGGLTQFGISEVTISPGSWSSQRHHHSAEDEFVLILSGTPTLVSDAGERELKAGDICAHPAGDGDAHHLINRSGADVVILTVGSRRPEVDTCSYPDVDIHLPANGTPQREYVRKG